MDRPLKIRLRVHAECGHLMKGWWCRDWLTEPDEPEKARQRRAQAAALAGQEEPGTNWKMLVAVMLGPLAVLACLIPFMQWALEEPIAATPCQGICHLNHSSLDGPWREEGREGECRV